MEALATFSVEQPLANPREAIQALEDALSKLPGAVFGDSDVLPLTHTFAEGVYVREMIIPKGYALTGKIHRYSHANFLMKGEIIVVTEKGGREHLKAPRYWVSAPGTKRAGLALEDTVWVTIHSNPNNETDLDKLEEVIIAKDFEALEKSRRPGMTQIGVSQ